MSVQIQHVDTNTVQQVWPLVEGYLADALDKGYDFPDWAHSYNVSHIQMYLTSGQWLLLVAVDEGQIQGAATVSFINYPLHRVAFVTATGGKFIVNPDTVEQLKNIVKLRGATKIQAYGRKTMVRLLAKSGFEPRNTLVEVLI
jgi:hypothetical protein